jgi:hypothetical protein
MNPLTKQVALGVFIGGLALLLLVAGVVTGYQRLTEYQQEQKEIEMKTSVFRSDAAVVYELISDYDKSPPSQFPELQENYLDNRLDLLGEAAQTDVEHNILAVLHNYQHELAMRRIAGVADTPDLPKARADAQAVFAKQ